MLLSVVSAETYCLKPQHHIPYFNGKHKVCYRCGMLLRSHSHKRVLGSLLDY